MPAYEAYVDKSHDVDELLESWTNGNCEYVMDILKTEHPYIAAEFVFFLYQDEGLKILKRLREDREQLLLDG